jgi:hypothetical protein
MLLPIEAVVVPHTVLWVLDDPIPSAVNSHGAALDMLLRDAELALVRISHVIWACLRKYQKRKVVNIY